MLGDPYAPFFQPTSIGALALRNRVAMAPMTRRRASRDRVPTAAMAAYYARRAAGGAGLIITEGAHMDGVHAPYAPRVPGIWTEAHRDGWCRVVDRVHRAKSGLGGRAAIALQLWHAGPGAFDPIGPSAVPAGPDRPAVREMTAPDIDRVLEAFARSAALAKEAGFDAVEIHGAHGYLLHAFLSPSDNRRSDDFGGIFENRARLARTVARAVKEAVGPDIPVIYRFSQWKMGDYEARLFPDAETLAEWVTGLAREGVDALHVSALRAVEPAFPGSPLTLAGWSKRLSGLPVIAVGAVSQSEPVSGGPTRIVDPRPAAALIARGEADVVAVGRSMIANPDWCELVAAGRWRELRPHDRSLMKKLV